MKTLLLTVATIIAAFSGLYAQNTITNQPISASLATPEQKPNAVNSQQAANLQQAQPGLQGQNPTPTVTKRKKSSLNEEKRFLRKNVQTKAQDFL